MGIGLIGWSYPQWGIVATVAHEKPHEGTAYEHFLPSGPFAILPMTENRSSLVWTEREEIAPQMLALSEDAFNAEVARRFGDHLGATKVVGPRWSYPLDSIWRAAMCAIVSRSRAMRRMAFIRLQGKVSISGSRMRRRWQKSCSTRRGWVSISAPSTC